MSNYFTISNATQNIDNIESGGIYLNIETPFEIQVSNDIPTGDYEFELVMISNNTEYAMYETKDIISLSVNNDYYGLGDINGDGGINIFDIIIITQLIINNDYDMNGDMNQDNQLNVLDILLIVNIILN